MCSPFQFRYTWELNFGQIIWDKIELVIGNILGNNLRTCEMLGEPDGNTLRNRKILPPFKEKNLAPHEGMLSILIGHMKLLFKKVFVIIFGLG
jgi:hypothetical protein